MAAGRIKLLTFDLDDTLWDFAPVLERAERITYEWLQRRAPALTERFSRETLRDLRLQLAQRQPDIAHRVSALRVISLREALIAADFAEHAAAALAEEAFAVFLEARHAVAYFESTETVLAELARRYKLGAITNGNVEVARLGLDRYFSLAINAERLTRAKPHPEPFLAALAQAGCNAAECIHIGDHIDHDMRAAQRLGMYTIWMNRAGAPWPDTAEAVARPTAEVRHLQELPDAVNRIDTNLI
jgi:FMN hydrolase / 5-amino-6-(5-phospho-D-ribitylamino)uracil phosphatase